MNRIKLEDDFDPVKPGDGSSPCIPPDSNEKQLMETGSDILMDQTEIHINLFLLFLRVVSTSRIPWPAAVVAINH